MSSIFDSVSLSSYELSSPFETRTEVLEIKLARPTFTGDQAPADEFCEGLTEYGISLPLEQLYLSFLSFYC